MTEAEWHAATDPMLEFLRGRASDRKLKLVMLACCRTFPEEQLPELSPALAEGIYADRAFDRLPIRADALQDAGCDHPDILSHCRGDGPHVRGCRVVDLLLGNE